MDAVLLALFLVQLVIVKVYVSARMDTLETNVINVHLDSTLKMEKLAWVTVPKTYLGNEITSHIFSDCACEISGSANNGTCDSTGQCTCESNVVGQKCDQCIDTFFGWPGCEEGKNLLNQYRYTVAKN